MRFGQRVRAFLLDGILRRQHKKWFRQRHRCASDRHAVLLHRLEQRRLRTRRRAIDFVGEDDVRKHRPAHKPKRPLPGRRVFFEDLGAGDVAWHEIRRELNASEVEVHGLGHRADHHRLGEPRHADEQRMAARDHRHEDFIEHVALPDDALRHLGAQSRCRGEQRLTFGGGDSHCDGAQRTGRRRR